MTSPQQIKASYQRTLSPVGGVGEYIVFRRYTSVGAIRTKVDIPNVRCRVTGYTPEELVGGIQQGDRRLIVYSDDIAQGQTTDSPPQSITLPITPADKVVVRGRELAIMAIDDSTRRVQGVLIAYEIQARG